MKLDNKKRSSITDGVLSIRKEKSVELTISASPKQTYANAHAYHINSISPNSDGETFLSADDLRINWWNKEISSSSFSKTNSFVLF
jgi:serine/threonine-protein phosphatase 2A regulatory subunit B